MRNTLVLLTVVGLCCAGSSLAGTKAGEHEVQLSGSIMNMSAGDSDTTTISAQAVYNRFIRDNISIGGTFRPTIYDQDSGSSRSIYLLGRSDYYFVSETDAVPYAGAHLGLVNYSDDDNSETVLTFGIQGGVKIFVKENVSITIELDYSRYDYQGETATVITFMAGPSVYF